VPNDIASRVRTESLTLLLSAALPSGCEGDDFESCTENGCVDTTGGTSSGGSGSGGTGNSGSGSGGVSSTGASGTSAGGTGGFGRDDGWNYSFGTVLAVRGSPSTLHHSTSFVA